MAMVSVVTIRQWNRRAFFESEPYNIPKQERSTICRRMLFSHAISTVSDVDECWRSRYGPFQPSTFLYAIRAEYVSTRPLSFIPHRSLPPSSDPLSALGVLPIMTQPNSGQTFFSVPDFLVSEHASSRFILKTSKFVSRTFISCIYHTLRFFRILQFRNIIASRITPGERQAWR